MKPNIYRYVLNLDTLEFKIEGYKYEEHRYLTHITYVLKGRCQFVYDKTLRKFEPHRYCNYFSCYSLDGNRMEEFKKLCIEKLEYYCRPKKENKKYDYKSILDELKHKEV